MVLICDFDGTLIDIWDKYYYSHIRACEDIIALPGEREDYKQAVKQGDYGFGVARANTRFKELNRKDEKAYFESFVKHVESPESLAKDSLLPGAIDFLQKATRGQLYLVSSRRKESLLKIQLYQLGIYHYFHGIRCGNKTRKTSWKFKARLTDRRWIEGGERETWLIGDMEDDILAARYLGIKSCAVVSGCRGEKYLRSFEPNRIISHVGSFPVAAFMEAD